MVSGAILHNVRKEDLFLRIGASTSVQPLRRPMTVHSSHEP